MEAPIIWPPYELMVRGSDSQIAQFLQKLEPTLKDGWRRDFEYESRLEKKSIWRRDDRCFTCSATDRRPAAVFFLGPRWPGGLHVSTVMPREKQRFTAEEYHIALSEFSSMWERS